MVSDTIRDVLHAARTIARMPILAIAVVVSLGAGIGVNTVVFSWMQAVVFHPIAGVDDAAGFHLIEPRTETGGYPGMSWLEYHDVRERVRSFDDLLAYRMTPLYIGEPGSVERGYGLLVSGNYFSVLRLRPALGRFLDADETTVPGSPPVAVISHDFWQTRFAGAPDVVGRSLRVNGQQVTIVGVAPKGFLGTVLRLEFDVWLPATLAPVLFPGTRELDRRTNRGYSVLGRLRGQASIAQARNDVDGAMNALAQSYPETNAGIRAEVLAFWQAPRGPQRFLATALTFLQIVMLLLLLTVCGNTANLMLARASVRRREMGLRLALGAGRWRIARLLLAENLLLALTGSALGIAVAIWGTQAMGAMPLSIGVPVNLATTVDSSGLLFAIALGVLCGVTFGLAPAMHLARIDPQLTFRVGSNAATKSVFRSALMGVQVALAVVVLVAAGLFLRRFMETRDIDPGFRREGVLLAAYDLTGRITDESASRTFAARLLQRLREVPAVESAAISSSVPLDIHGLPSRGFAVDGWTRSEPGLEQATTNTVTRGYFALMNIPILAGSDFADLDDGRAAPQAIVNIAFVRRYLKTLEPIGRRLQSRGRDYVITGVVQNSLSNAFGEPPTPVVYFSYRDNPSRGGEIHLRARAGSETALAPSVRRIIRDLDPELPVYNIRTLTDHVETNLLFRRIPARMFVVLGPMLVILAAIGIYAVVAYNVSQRTIEVGVRLALGGTRARVIAELVGESMGIILVGVMAGWLIAFVLAPLAIGRSFDLTVFLGVPVLLLAVSAVACWIPARRAAHLEPSIALRAE